MGKRFRFTLTVNVLLRDMVLAGRGTDVWLPCGCSLVVRDRKLTFQTCDDPHHVAWNREQAHEAALQAEVELTEVELPAEVVN